MKVERYEEIKKILKDNKISSKELDEYRAMCLVKYAEHKNEIKLPESYFDAKVAQVMTERQEYNDKIIMSTELPANAQADTVDPKSV